MMSSVSEIKKENADDKTPPPKKRGRKRKSEIPAQDVQKTVETSSTPVETVSRRGRPRKKVNYYELANPENVEDIQTDFDREIKFLSLANDETKSVKKKKTIQKNASEENASDTRLEMNDLCNNEQESDVAFQLQNNHCDEINKSNKISGDSSTIIEGNDVDSGDITITQEKHDDRINGSIQRKECATPEINAFDLEVNASSSKMKDKKYNYTGETVKMMNTLFTLFASQSGGTPENATCNIVNGTTNSSSCNDNTLQTPNDNGKRPNRKYKKAKIKEEPDDGTDNVICAVCNSTMDKSAWNHHKQRYHNNLAWRVGDAPLDLSDQSFVMHTLNMLYKKKKPLYCDKCGEVKKSVVGFLSHQSTCKKSEEQLESVKITCELCGRKMLPVSLSTHMKFTHQNPSQKIEVVEKTNNNENSKPLPTKRSAAKKAMRIIENVTKNDATEEQHFTSNLDFTTQDFVKELLQKELEEKQIIECKFRCDFLATSLEEALTHSKHCTEKPPQGYACKKCLQVSTKLEAIIYHIELDHDVSIEVEDDPTFADKGNMKMPSFLYSTVKKTERVLFPSAFDWTYKFQEENFTDLIFQNLSFNELYWQLLPSAEVECYLPKLNESCDVTRMHVTSFINPLNEEYKFRRYALFESELHEDNKITIFCGGPVSSMSWLPTPCTKMNENQILAVSVLSSPDRKYLTNENYEERSCIQFWNFGCLKNHKRSMKVPELVYSIAHSHGPIWHMEWCPSGCYNFSEDKISRMGLLATAGSDSAVYVYSVPFFKEDLIGLYYKLKPVLKLLLQRPGSSLLGGLKYYATKISWSKACGHCYIAVGYTNGFVALFNLNTSSPILRYKGPDGVTCILPNKCFQAHSHSISALALYHLNGGCRWLMTGSVDRAVNLWDLDNYSYPISSTKKNIITDGFWLSNWLCYFTAADEGSTSMYVTTMLKQTRDYVCDSNVTLTFSPSTISTISGSDWLNGMLHGNTVGEIVALFPHQLLQVTEHRKVFKNKRMLFGYACLIEKGKTPEQRVEDDRIKKKTLQNLLTKKLSVGVKLSTIKSDYDHSDLFCDEPVLYQQAKQKYGLLFCDNRLESYNDLPKTTAHQLSAFSKSYGVTHPNQYPLTAINKIVFNPNRQASLYYASGYQAGFVRISWMEFLKEDQQIK